MGNELIMELSEIEIQIIKGLICPYCKKQSKHVNSSVIYGKDYGMIYLCGPCDAYVGCHKSNTTEAKGRLAKKELRELKKEAHLYFDKIWQLKIMSRHEAYKWLSGYLQLPAKYTHIGMLGIEKTKEVMTGSKQLLNDNRRLDLYLGTEPITPYYE